MEHDYIKLNECIICLESNDTDKSIHKLITFKQKCRCDSYIHKECLLKWYSYNRICPICKTNIGNDILPINNTMEEEEEELNYTIFQIFRCRDCINTFLVKCICYIVITIVIALGCNRDLFKSQTDN